MAYLLDTNACIKYLNGTSESIRQRLESAHPQDIVLCSIVNAELFYGVMKSANPEKNLAKLQQFVNPFASLPFDDKAAEEYGRIRAQFKKLGTPIGPNDLLIAAIAVSRDVTLVTHNTREFNRVVDLQFEDWEI
jgi:tRNA(fMet)-specific endonuclease VapC